MRLLAIWGAARALCVGKITKRALQELKNPYNEHRSIAMRLRQKHANNACPGGGIGRHATLRG